MVTNSWGCRETQPLWLAEPVQGLENQFSMPFGMGPGHRPAQKLSVNWRGYFHVIFSNSLKDCLCRVSFTKPVRTVWEHWHCSYLVLSKIGVTGSLTCSSPPREWEEGAVLTHAWQSIFWTSWSKTSIGRFQLILTVAEWLLRASWLLLVLGHPHLNLAWLCSSSLLRTCLGSPVKHKFHFPFQSGIGLSIGPGISQ